MGPARLSPSSAHLNPLPPAFPRFLPQVLEEFGVPLELTVVSAHRTPERMMEYARTAPQRGLKVIIAGAGGGAEDPRT